MKAFLVAVVLLVGWISSGDAVATKCYHCDDTNLDTECKTVETCEPDSVCMTNYAWDWMYRINLAKGGKVAQSSVHGGGEPTRAIDGNRASDWYKNSCTHTSNDLNPWWILDLKSTYAVTYVTITNREDCCSERLNGAEIRIGDSLDNNGNSNPRCAVISSIPAGATHTFKCKGMVGRYVNIVIPGRKEYLTLCEVEVYGYTVGKPPAAGINLAKGGKVAQSSVHGGGEPTRAVDGNRASDWYKNSCTHTSNDFKPWWVLDLKSTHVVNFVTITNRADCCSERLNGAEIRIGDSLTDNGNSNPRCAVISSIPAGETHSFNCKGMVGRYVNIVIPGRKEYLTLCEVEVYGYAIGIPPATGINVARAGNVTQSSVHGGGEPTRAIDGNRASDWYKNSCTHTSNDFKPWWRVDLQNPHVVNFVTVTNREDCCDDRLDGAEIRIGDSLTDNGNSNPRCAVISSIAAGGTHSFNCKGMVGRYVNIVIPERKEYLTLCEVEVYGYAIGKPRPAGINLAKGGKVAQSSVHGGGEPTRAIDGNRASDWYENSCTHTSNDFKPWWVLDLKNPHVVNFVTITNRKDCCSERLNGAEIRIGDSLTDNGNRNPRCAVISSIPAGASQTFYCKGMVGRYVNIVIPGRKEQLTLCEVEVYGDSIAQFIPSEAIYTKGCVKASDPVTSNEVSQVDTCSSDLCNNN